MNLSYRRFLVYCYRALNICKPGSIKDEDTTQLIVQPQNRQSLGSDSCAQKTSKGRGHA